MKDEWHRVLMCGDRYWGRMSTIQKDVKALKARHGDKLIIIQGGADGADTMAEIACQQESVHCAEVKALWSTRHISAGPQRNTAMLKGLMPDEVIAYHPNIGKGKGTKDMVKQAKDAGVPVRVRAR
jgi:hypothetical protein